LVRPLDELRHHDVLQRGEFRQQVMELVDEADLVAADRRALVVRQPPAGMAVEDDVAGIRLLEKARRVQQRRLAGTGRGDERHHLAGLQREMAPLRIVSLVAPWP
jgi:hypothetical protein